MRPAMQAGWTAPGSAPRGGWGSRVLRAVLALWLLAVGLAIGALVLLGVGLASLVARLTGRRLLPRRPVFVARGWGPRQGASGAPDAPHTAGRGPATHADVIDIEAREIR